MKKRLLRSVTAVDADGKSPHHNSLTFAEAGVIKWEPSYRTIYKKKSAK